MPNSNRPATENPQISAVTEVSQNVQPAPILVIGSTGKSGRRVVERLQQRGQAVRGVSRRTTPAFDWENASTWPAALAGVEAAYITFAPDLAAPGAPETMAEFTAVAKAHGVRHLVLLSGRGETNAERSEQVVQNSGLSWTILRASWFVQNFTEGLLRDAVMGGVLAMPAGDVTEPFIDLDDLADVAVAALTEEGHAGRLYELTGPRLLTFAQAATELSAASGREVTYVPVSAEQFHAALVPEVGPDMADMLTDLCAEVFDGRNESLADGVQQALGRPARDFTEVCADAAAAGAWKD